MKRIYWLASFPKSGNTWFRIFLKNYLLDGKEPFNINESLQNLPIASSRETFDTFTGLESALMTQEEIERLQPAAFEHIARVSTETHYIKIHDACNEVMPGLPIVSVEGTEKALYILRNPLDVAISFADHFGCGIDESISLIGDKNLAHCAEKDKSGKQLRHRLNNWSDHVASWVDAPWFPVEVLRYEEMKEYPFAAFGRAIRFLEIPCDEERLKKAILFSDFNELKKQEREKGFKQKSPFSTNGFFRKGEIGQWKEILTQEHIRRIVHDHGSVMRRFGYLDLVDPELIKEINR